MGSPTENGPSAGAGRLCSSSGPYRSLEVAMGRTAAVLALFIFVPSQAPAAEPTLSREDKVFFEGVSAGMMTMNEASVVDAFTSLLALEKVPGTEEYRGLLVGRMNTAVFALSFVDRDVKIRPAMLKTIAAMSSPQMKGFMADVKKARLEHKWQAPDTKQEEKIGWVLDRYVKTGNIYGFE